MIVCLSLNPCLDQSASIPRFSYDSPNRIAVERLDVGGKGINVARVLTELGESCLVVGFDYAGAPLCAALAEEGVACRLVPVAGKLRVNLKLKEIETGRTIEISERGATVTPEQVQKVGERLLDRCAPGDWAVLCGSLPPGAGSETYGSLCAALKEKGCRVAADCDGDALLHVLLTRPDLIKPNEQEFQALTGVSAGDLPAALRACQTLHSRGVGAVCLSRGAEGALLSTPEGAFLSPAAPVVPQGVQGAGDSLLAGLLFALNRGETPQNALRYASAAAGASVMRPGTLLGKKEDVEALLPGMTAERCCF